MKKFIPKEKLGKKARKQLDTEQRSTWAFSPVTKKVESKKLYNRKRKAHDRYDDYGMGFSFLGDVQAQHAMLQLRADVSLRERIAHIEAPLHRTGPAFLTDNLALLRGLILVETLRGGHGQIAVLQLQRDVFLLEARQINIDFVVIFMLMHVGLHLAGGVLAIQLAVHPPNLTIPVTKEFVKQVFTKDTRHQHNSYLL